MPGPRVQHVEEASSIRLDIEARIRAWKDQIAVKADNRPAVAAAGAWEAIHGRGG